MLDSKHVWLRDPGVSECNMVLFYLAKAFFWHVTVRKAQMWLINGMTALCTLDYCHIVRAYYQTWQCHGEVLHYPKFQNVTTMLLNWLSLLLLFKMFFAPTKVMAASKLLPLWSDCFRCVYSRVIQWFLFLTGWKEVIGKESLTMVYGLSSPSLNPTFLYLCVFFPFSFFFFFCTESWILKQFILKFSAFLKH